MQIQDFQTIESKINVKSNTTNMVVKRDGSIVEFNPARIRRAIEKAYLAEFSMTAAYNNEIDLITADVIEGVTSRHSFTIESIQDEVERALFKAGKFQIGRRYIVYREERSRARLLQKEGTYSYNVSWSKIESILKWSLRDLQAVSFARLVDELAKNIIQEMNENDLIKSAIYAARSLIEIEPTYSKVASRLLLASIYLEVLNFNVATADITTSYQENFANYLDMGIVADRISPALKNFNLSEIKAALRPERDDLFQYLGIQTLYDRYLLHITKKRIELPQYLWMRVAMGVSINEANPTERAIEFYNLISTFRYTPSTPTLFNSGTNHPQLSSCFLTTITDDLSQIFKAIGDNAKLSKWAGGLGNDWTNVRGTGALIQGTNGESQGVIPFLKVANSTAVAVNQGGKRQGAVCAYLESWHIDVEEFLDLRKNTGDDRRRTHDMNTANWIPDLFMKRVRANQDWTLFSPDETPDLHDLYGKNFEERYISYEALADIGKIKLWKRIPASQLWRKMLSSLYETGHPWITFKDPSNIRSPQSHIGVVHSSNLCTEILLNTSEDESAVCNLGSINLVNHLTGDFSNRTIDSALLSDTIRTAVRMLDNVIDITFYPTAETKNSNSRHRPVGLGLMGFQDILSQFTMSYASDAAVELADNLMEEISFHAISASADLAAERGTYGSYQGSKWSNGLLPIDTLKMLENERGIELNTTKNEKLDWSSVRTKIKAHGMRNSNVMAIAPTATISNIVGVSPSIEPNYRNLYVKSNMSGDFTMVNPYLVEDLKKLNLWSEEFVEKLKYFDGSLQQMEELPIDIRERYRTSFEIDARWLIDAAARRQKWIDQGQSLNLYVLGTSGKQLDEMYQYAWECGLKTTYYLRSVAATQVEKSSIDVNRFGIQPRWMKSKSASSEISKESQPRECNMDEGCEVCQ